MTVCLQKRGDIIHIIGWTTGKGGHYTLCDKFFIKDKMLQTFGLNNTIDGMCRTCRVAYDTMYKDDLEYFIRLSHGQLHEKLADKFKDIEQGHLTIDEIYSYLETQFGNFNFSYKRKRFALSYYK